MQWIRPFIFLIIFLILPVIPLFAQDKEPRILFLVDASGSMNLPWLDHTPRFEAAREIVIELMENAQLEANNISFAVRVFGAHHPAKEENCFDTSLEIPFRYQNLNQVKARMKSIHPQGASPIAYSLEKAATEDFNEPDKYNYSLILITDGDETCHGDICAIMEQLLSKKVSFKPYIISLVNEAPLENLYSCLGDYSVVANRTDIHSIVERILAENETILKITPPSRRAAPPSTPTPTIAPSTINNKIVITEIDTPLVNNHVSITPPPEVSDEVEHTLRPFFRLPKGKLFVRVTPLSLLTPQRVWPTFNKPVAQKTIIEEAPPTTTIITQNPAPSNFRAPSTQERPPIVDVQAIEEHSTTQEKAEKTYVEVYFVTREGKHYWTEPVVKVSNSATHDTVLSFNRHVNGQQVRRMEIAPGTYNFTIPNSKSSAKNVTIVENNINKVYILVQTGSLAFYHPEDPKVSVSQYQAFVSKTFNRNAPVVVHPCDETLPYDPDNYHIEINTLPPLMYNLDINFTSIKLVAIPQPGYIQIANENRMGEVEFYTLRGNKYVPFHKMLITGNPEEQLLEFLPGRYQVRYFKGAQHAGQNPEVVSFTITGKETTTIHLSQ